ncbi:hypothetical protein [Cryobacterium sp. N22]|uniref:hypothetical protein n=1 Tax=Cryobacterium sp. N22 TaxID=2048290 RepID=UPI001304E584|nr:hypothetical protein [Cryobacterium sp. N22]
MTVHIWSITRTTSDKGVDSVSMSTAQRAAQAAPAYVIGIDYRAAVEIAAVPA